MGRRVVSVAFVICEIGMSAVRLQLSANRLAFSLGEAEILSALALTTSTAHFTIRKLSQNTLHRLACKLD